MGTPPAATAIHLPLSLMSDVPSGGANYVSLSLSSPFICSCKRLHCSRIWRGHLNLFFHFGDKGERERVEGREICPCSAPNVELDALLFSLPRKRTIPPFFLSSRHAPNLFFAHCASPMPLGRLVRMQPADPKGFTKKISQSSSPSANEKKVHLISEFQGRRTEMENLSNCCFAAGACSRQKCFGPLFKM